MTTNITANQFAVLPNNETEVSEVDCFREAISLGREVEVLIHAVNQKQETFREDLKKELGEAFTRMASRKVRHVMYLKAALHLETLRRSEQDKVVRRALKAGINALYALHDEFVGADRWYQRSAPARRATLAKLQELEARTETVLELEEVIERKVGGTLREIQANTSHLGGIATEMAKLNAPARAEASAN